MSEIEDIIKSSVTFHEVTASGFHTMKCPVCNDTKVRGGFAFFPDRIAYNCFRGKCDASTEYKYDAYMPKRFRHLMDVLGVDVPIELKVYNKKPKIFDKLNEDIYEKHSYSTIEIPSDFVQYHPDYHYWFDDFLKSRHVTFTQDLYVGKEDTWKNKLIIPFYYHGKLIGWQGVSVFDGKTFYLTSGDNTDLMFINNHNGYIKKNPIVVEGIMDAASIPDAIAILGNSVSKKQAYLLKGHDPILLPDRKDSDFIKIAKRYGWRISIPEWKVKDANAAIQTYGKFVTMKMIHDGIQDNMLKAEVKLNLWKTK